MGKRFLVVSFGESHGRCVGAVVDGCPAGLELREEDIQRELDLRKPSSSLVSTERREEDRVEILSGVFEGYTTGAPICMLVWNRNVRSEDYEVLRYKPRPSHADYYAYVKYRGFNDYRGGGRFSGRITAGFVIAGAIARELITLRQKEKIPPLIFSVDEAHMFIPSSGDSPASQVIRELIRMGRHIGIGLILITQNPMDIDKRTIKLTNTRFIFALEQDQLEHLKGVFSDTPKEIIANLPKLETGTCLMTGSRESIRHAVLVKIRKRRTTHGGETPSMVVE